MLLMLLHLHQRMNEEDTAQLHRIASVLVASVGSQLSWPSDEREAIAEVTSLATHGSRLRLPLEQQGAHQ